MPAPGAVISCSRSVENFDAQRPLSMVMVTVLYKNNMLLDINFERAENVTDSHLFETSFTMPQDIAGCSVHMILLDADSMVPMSECVIKE